MDNVCPEMADPVDCEMKVGQWWGYISQIAFNDQVSKYFCYILDPECNLFTDEFDWIAAVSGGSVASCIVPI